MCLSLLFGQLLAPCWPSLLTSTPIPTIPYHSPCQTVFSWRKFLLSSPIWSSIPGCSSLKDGFRTPWLHLSWFSRLEYLILNFSRTFNNTKTRICLLSEYLMYLSGYLKTPPGSLPCRQGWRRLVSFEHTVHMSTVFCCRHPKHLLFCLYFYYFRQTIINLRGAFSCNRHSDSCKLLLEKP